MNFGKLKKCGEEPGTNLMKNNITAIILTGNEEDNILKCLEALKICDQILVIDDFSTDKTVERINSLNKSEDFPKHEVKIYQNRVNGDFGAQRNFAINKAENEWLLFIDADEIITSSLMEEIILNTSTDRGFNAFYIKRKDYFLGKLLNYGETGNISFIRLAKKGKGEWKGKVHEIWQIEGNIGKLENPLYHYSHKSIKGFLQKINSYSDIVAQYWIEKGRRSGLYQILFVPFLKFVYNYWTRMGFLDGIHGFIMAVMMSFHSFLVRSKVYLHQLR